MRYPAGELLVERALVVAKLSRRLSEAKHRQRDMAALLERACSKLTRHAGGRNGSNFECTEEGQEERQSVGEEEGEAAQTGRDEDDCGRGSDDAEKSDDMPIGEHEDWGKDDGADELSQAITMLIRCLAGVSVCVGV